MMRIVYYEKKRANLQACLKAFALSLAFMLVLVYAQYGLPFFNGEGVSGSDIQEAYDTLSGRTGYGQREVDFGGLTFGDVRRMRAMDYVGRRLSGGGDDGEGLKGIPPEEGSFAARANGVRLGRERRVSASPVLTGNYEFLVDNPAIDIAILACLLVAAYYTYVGECFSETGSYVLRLSAQPWKVMLARHLLFFLCAAAYCLAFYLAAAAEVAALSHRNLDLFSPIQAFYGYEKSFFYGRFWQFLVVLFWMKVLGLCLIVLVFVLVWCSFSNFALGAMVALGFVLGELAMGYTMAPATPTGVGLARAFGLSGYFRYLYFDNVFGCPVDVTATYLTYRLALLVPVAVLVGFLTGIKKPAMRFGYRRRVKRRGLYGFEMKKLFADSRGWVVIAATAAMAWLVLGRYGTRSGEEYYYKAYCMHLKGRPFAYAADFVKEERAAIEERLASEVPADSLLEERSEGLGRMERQVAELGGLPDGAQAVVYQTPPRNVMSAAWVLLHPLCCIATGLFVLALDLRNEVQGQVLLALKGFEGRTRTILEHKWRAAASFLIAEDLAITVPLLAYLVGENGWDASILLARVDNVFTPLRVGAGSILFWGMLFFFTRCAGYLAFCRLTLRKMYAQFSACSVVQRTGC